ECKLQIDHDYVATVYLRSTGRGSETRAEFHDLDFGLSLPQRSGPAEREGDEPNSDSTELPPLGAFDASDVIQRTNIVLEGSPSDRLWQLVPGDIIAKWQPNHFDIRSGAASEFQKDERNFYVPCARCGRLISRIKAEGSVEACRGRKCGAHLQPLSDS